MILKYHQLNKIILFMAYFVTTLSYVPKLGLESFKILAVAITLFFPLLKIVRFGKIRKTDLYLFIILVCSCLFQDTSVSQKFFSIFFYATLIIWSLHGDEIFITRFSMQYAGLAISLGIFIGLALSVNEVAAQLNSIYNWRLRLWGGFSHPNHLGGMSATAIILLFSYKVLSWEEGRENKLSGKYFIYALVSLLTLVLYLTKSRTSWIMTAVFYIIFAMRKFDKLNIKSKIFVGILLIGGAGWIIWNFYTEYVLQDAAYMARLHIFETMIVTPKTLFVGNGMVNAVSLNRVNTGGGSMEIAWVMLFYKNGLIGIIAYVYILVKVVKEALKKINMTQRWLCFAVFGAMMTGSLGEAYLVNITNVQPMALWILFSALASSSFARRNHKLI